MITFYKTVGKTVGKNKDVIEKKIINLLKKDNKMRYKSLAEKLKVDEKTIERHLRDMKEKGYIARMGSHRNGWWKVLV